MKTYLKSKSERKTTTTTALTTSDGTENKAKVSVLAKGKSLETITYTLSES